jgi:hypothetical protein
MLIFSFREGDFFVSLDMVKKVIINRLEAFIENLKVISCKNINKLLDIFIVSVSVFG